MNHTPGPWHWNHNECGLENDSGDEVLTYAPYEGMWLSYSEHQKGNKLLIAAAPDMLEALRRVVSIAEDHPDEITDALPELRAAIAKATGNG